VAGTWCAAVTVAVCGESGQWRCGKRCDTAGMARRLKRRCLAINRLCGEFPSVTLTRDAAVVGQLTVATTAEIHCGAKCVQSVSV
jgi:hypothetical protein